MIDSEIIQLGLNTFIHETAKIRGINGPAQKIIIGDNCYIGEGVEIICDNFELGDYGKIHKFSTIHGYSKCTIGHNLWMGQFCIVDSIGGVSIGNNCGIGANSQLWSHIKYGDTLEGCKFNSSKSMNVGNDVWFVGHCIVSPINAEDRSMALVGSVIVKDMKYNEIYSGVPAKSISSKVGFQFAEKTLEEKYQQFTNIFKEYSGDKKNLHICKTIEEAQVNNEHCTYFILESRSYTKRKSAQEINFMKYLLPEKAKFTPIYDSF